MTQALPSFASWPPPPAAPRFAEGDRVVDRVHLRGLPNYGEGTIQEVATTTGGLSFYVVLFDDGELRAVADSCLDLVPAPGVYTSGGMQ